MAVGRLRPIRTQFIQVASLAAWRPSDILDGSSSVLTNIVDKARKETTSQCTTFTQSVVIVNITSLTRTVEPCVAVASQNPIALSQMASTVR